ncbi:zinc finger protein 518A [Tachyglossus aculeatus]|uniref:zinc finger protein 518A n=1 Tax=Tachyglossus aculeatus TaxID=9261 RepID=UPI0018F69018|nr:zinc finger protein 518A [Tachyglossus aculeatus]
MPSKKKHFFNDEEKTILLRDIGAKKRFVNDVEIGIVHDTLMSASQPTFLEDSLSYELKTVKINLPKVNIPKAVALQHEGDRFRKLFQNKPQTARKSLSTETVNASSLHCLEEQSLLHKSEGQFEEEGMKTAAKILNFNCSKCRNNIRYSPNDLQKHFQLWHQGELPSYPCEMCSFSANDFQAFKQHRRTHRSTLVKCEICNDETTYTLLDLTKHFTSKHCVKGNFQCEKCKFSTKDVGTFVQHIHRHNEIHYKCGQCPHVSFTKGEFQRHLLVHSDTFPFSCQYCSYSAMRKDHLIRHVIGSHKDNLYAKEKLEKDNCEKRIMKASSGLKLILKRYKMGTSRKTLWRREKMNSASDGCTEKDTQVLKSLNKIQCNAEEQNQLLKGLHVSEEKTVCNEKQTQNYADSEMRTPSTPQNNKTEEESSSGLGSLKNTVHGPTVLMVKNNKITVPANYSAKFMGFKLVDGKQHIVIKLLPTSKHNLHSSGRQSDEFRGSTTHSQLHPGDTTGLSAPGASLHAHQLNNTVCTRSSTTLSFSALPFSGKVEPEKRKTALARCKRKSVTGASESKAAGKNPPHLSTKPELATAPLNLSVKVGPRGSVGPCGSCITQSHPQVLCTTVTSPVSMESLKASYPAELKAQNSRRTGNHTVNCLNYMSSVDDSSHPPEALPLRNYSKMRILGNPCRISVGAHENLKGEPQLSKMFHHNCSLGHEPSPSFPPLAKGSKNPGSLLESPSQSSKAYCSLNIKDTCGSLKSESFRDADRPCFLGRGQSNGQQYLHTNENQGFENISETSKWDCTSFVNSSSMPKITSVFSLQSKQASHFLSPEVKQVLQEVLKVKSSTHEESHNILDKGLKLEQPFWKQEEASNIVPCVKDSTTCCLPFPSSRMGVTVPPRDLNVKDNPANSVMYYGKEGQVPSTSNEFGNSETISRGSGVNTLRKTRADRTVTQQLVRDTARTTAMDTPVNSEPNKAVFVQSTSKGFLIPLHLANKPGLRVVSGRSRSSVNPPDVYSTSGLPASLLRNRGPGMILTLSNKMLGAAATVPDDSARVFGGATTKESNRTPLKAERKSDHSTGVVCSSAFGSSPDVTVSSANSVPFKGPYVLSGPAETAGRDIASLNVLSERGGCVLGTLDSVQQQREFQQKPSLRAALPEGQPTVLLKCVTTNKPKVHKPEVVQDNAGSRSPQPKKSEGMQQKLLLKIVKNPPIEVLADNQSGNNSRPTLRQDSLRSQKTSSAEQKQPVSSSDAVLFSDRLVPASMLDVTSTATDCSKKSGYPTYQREAQLLRCKTYCTWGSGLSNEKPSWNTRNKSSKIRTHLKPKDPETGLACKTRNGRRKAEVDFQEPPKKKVAVSRKCKRKTQTEDAQESPGFCRPKLSTDTLRILRLFPFSSKQLVKCPRRNQPVVVLNHPDADSPEVINVMKTITKYQGNVLKVSLSKRTINTLLEPANCNVPNASLDEISAKRYRRRKSYCSVKERFVLKLTLKKTSKNKYQIVKTTSDNTLKAKFSCWFCGRIFDNQDNWVGHGQRHLMEATRNWDLLG